MAKNFIVNRDDVWIGLLFGTDEKDYDKNEKYNKYHMGDTLYRYIVFTLDNNELAHDLLYTQEKPYPLVFKDYNVDVDRNTVISEYYNIGPLLKKLDYPQLLDQRTLTNAIKSIVSYYKIDRHLALFGLARYSDNYVSIEYPENERPKDLLNPQLFFTIKYHMALVVSEKPNVLELNVTKKS